MKIQKSWIEEYIGKKISTERLKDILIMAGVDVECVYKSIDDNVVVAKIESVGKHSNADKLQIVTISDGIANTRVVCGASNIKVGDIVPLAKPGAIILGQELKQVNIRGEDSFGMLCAGDELGINNDHSGIYLLPKDYVLGKKLNEYVLGDAVFEISPTANRGDCLSHIGIAREVAVYENSSIKKLPIALKKIDSDHTSTEIIIDIKEPNFCKQYMTRVIKGVKISPSPKWLQECLIASGAKPINNVVDVTNYILLDLGHPMHAFDQSKINGKKIVVRKAKNNEDIITLDGEIRNLDKEMVVIADEKKPIALAGVMGGQNSEVDDKTETVVLEAAEFERRNIRATSKKLNISTEASYRFERGIDSSSIEYAINKAANMICEISGGRVLSGIVCFGQTDPKVSLIVEYEKIRFLLGIDSSNDEINTILRLLGFIINGKNCEVPAWRHDIAIWQDLAEEIGRVIGYDKIKKIDLSKIKNSNKTVFYQTEQIKDFVVDHGFTETMNYPFLSESDLHSINLDSKNLLEIANPLQPENKYLRNSLLPGLLKNVSKNSAFDQIKLFEIGHIYTKNQEDQFLAIASTDTDLKLFSEWVLKLSSHIGINVKLFDIKKFDRGNLVNYKIKRPSVLTAEINLSKALKNVEINQKITLKKYNKNIIYRGVSKFPAITRDLAFVLDQKLNNSDLVLDIYEISNLVNRVEVFDEFISDKIGKNKKSVAFHIFLQSFTKTLIDMEADKVIENIIFQIEKKYRAKLRS